MFESTQQHISHFLEHSWWLKLCFKIIMLSEKKKIIKEVLQNAMNTGSG